MQERASEVLDAVTGLSADPGFALAAVQALFEVRPLGRGGVEHRGGAEEKAMQAAVRGLAAVYFENRTDAVTCRLIAEGVSQYGPSRTTALCVELAVLCGMPRPHEYHITPYAVVELQWYLPAVLAPHHWSRAALDVWYRSIVQLVKVTEEESGSVSASVLAERCSHIVAVCDDRATRKYLLKLQRRHRRTHRVGLIERWWVAPEKRLRQRGYLQKSGSGRALPGDIAWIARFHHAYSSFLEQYEVGAATDVQPVEI